MKLRSIIELTDRLEQKFRNSVLYYGTGDAEKNGTGFRIKGIDAIFSVVILEETPAGKYDVQVESDPPGDYIYNTVEDIVGVLDLIECYRAPETKWPKMQDPDN